MRKLLIFFFFPFLVLSQNKSSLIIHADEPQETISRHIYGQFSEHLGRGIYEGIWVGENSKIPNTRGIRNDVVNALKKLNVPNLRWPGGCFADEYHWMDGIGDPSARPKMINTNWGGVVEDNSFGTHQFLDLCAQLGAEPYITANVGSGSVEEMSKWVEYLNFDGHSPMADLRRNNGRDKPWGVKYWGVGNENWGCGGNMRPEFYADVYSRYATYCRNYGNNKLFKIAGGPSEDDYNWMEVLLKNIKHNLMNGISVHYYTVDKSWRNKVSATQFNESDYIELLKKSTRMDEILTGHIALLDKYDPENRLSLVVDEWGTWHAEEPGTKRGFLYQQNTLRDAFVAALTLNIFHKHARRVHMANIAQTINVLQAMILTNKEKILLTPTYYVFEMYKTHMDARFLPMEIKTVKYKVGDISMDALSATSSMAKDGSITISLANLPASEKMNVECDLRGVKIKEITGKILTAPAINSYNSFENPDLVKSEGFSAFKITEGKLILKMPEKSIVTLYIQQN